MKRIVVLSGLVLGLISCTQPKYFVKSEKDLSQINWKYNSVNYIPLTDNYVKNSAILDTTQRFILLEKYSKLNHFLSSVQSETPDFYLAKTLYHISRTEYQDAAIYLRMINDNYYTEIKDLLSIDLSYELAKLNGSKNYKKFLKDYQELIDKYPNNELLTKIIALRTRYIRYNY